MTLLCRKDPEGSISSRGVWPRFPSLASLPRLVLWAEATSGPLDVSSLPWARAISSLPLSFFSPQPFLAPGKSYILFFICLPKQDVSFPRGEAVFCSLLYPQGLEQSLENDRLLKECTYFTKIKLPTLHNRKLRCYWLICLQLILHSYPPKL